MKVAVVILNWNGCKMLERYLPSVVKYSQPEADVIVADNSSTDNSVSWLKNNYPNIRQIRLSDNYGFAGGYNRALSQVTADYYVLLNSDVEVTKNWLSPLLEKLNSDKDVAACQPKLLSFSSRESFEYAGASGGFIDRYGYPFCRGRLFDTIEKDNSQYNDPIQIFWATGACLMIRSYDYWKVGGLDERFFAHNEEIDLCWRLNRLGRKIYCIPKSYVYHLGGGTLPKSNPQKTYLNFRNNLTMLWKNLPPTELNRVMKVRMLLDYLAAFQMLLLKFNLGDFLAIFKARRAFQQWKQSFPRNLSTTDVDMRKHYSILWQYYVNKHKYFRDLP